jgi:hypothetical protein
MKHIFFLIITSLLFINCNKQSSISEKYYCDSDFINSKVEKVEDFNKDFHVYLPVNWKTNLYYDDIESSIYSADTTKQLRNATILDITLIKSSINFNDEMKLKFEQEKLANGLIRIDHQKLNFLDRESYITRFNGVKNNISYRQLDFFVKINNMKFLHSKVSIYGDTLVDQRICKAIQLIEKIKIYQ